MRKADLQTNIELFFLYMTGSRNDGTSRAFYLNEHWTFVVSLQSGVQRTEVSPASLQERGDYHHYFFFIMMTLASYYWLLQWIQLRQFFMSLETTWVIFVGFLLLIIFMMWGYSYLFAASWAENNCCIKLQWVESLCGPQQVYIE